MMPMKHLLKWIAIILLPVSTAFGQEEVVVALVDTGVSASNVNIAPGGFDFFNNRSDTSDQTSIAHGSVSAQIVQSFFSGSIIPLKVTDGNFNSSQVAVNEALNSIVDNAEVRVVVMSEGQAGPPSTLTAVSDAGKLISIRSGNTFSDAPSSLAQFAAPLPGVVIVGGAGPGEQLLPESNRAGPTADRYVVTFGSTNLSPIHGTSFASARIGGIAAAVFEQNPELTGEDVAQVIFRSAIDRGDPGVDPVWGHGWIADAEQVLSMPIGPVTVPGGENAGSGNGGGGGGGSAAAGAALLVGAAAGAILLTRRGKLEKTLVLDSYGRPFEIDLGERMRVNDPQLSVSQFFSAYDERVGAHRFGLGLEHANLDVVYSSFDTRVVDMDRYHAMQGDVAYAHQDIDYSFSFAGAHENGVFYRVDHNTNPAFRFGGVAGVAAASGFGNIAFLSGQSFASPYLGFSDRANSLSLGFAGKRGGKISMGLVSVDEDRSFGRESVAAILEGEMAFSERVSLAAQFGQLKEEGSLFGGSNGGAFGVETTETYALNLSGRWRPWGNISVVGNYGRGYSIVREYDESLLRNFSNIHSEWFGLGLVAEGVFTDRDQLGVAMSQPLRITRGEVDYSVPVGLDRQRRIIKDTERVSLTPDGAERTLEAYYRRMLTTRTEIGAFFLARKDPNHFRGDKTEYTVMGTLRLAY